MFEKFDKILSGLRLFLKLLEDFEGFLRMSKEFLKGFSLLCLLSFTSFYNGMILSVKELAEIPITEMFLFSHQLEFVGTWPRLLCTLRAGARSSLGYKLKDALHRSSIVRARSECRAFQISQNMINIVCLICIHYSSQFYSLYSVRIRNCIWYLNKFARTVQTYDTVQYLVWTRPLQYMDYMRVTDTRIMLILLNVLVSILIDYVHFV